MAYYTVVSKRGIVPPPVGHAEMSLLRDINISLFYIQRKACEFLREYTPVRTGFLRSRIKVWGTRTGSLGGFAFYLGWRKTDFGQKFYAPFVDQGTGIFGRFKRPITPKRAKMLAWEDDGRWVRVPYTLGQMGQNMLAKANNDWIIWMLQYIEMKRVAAWRRTL